MPWPRTERSVRLCRVDARSAFSNFRCRNSRDHSQPERRCDDHAPKRPTRRRVLGWFVPIQIFQRRIHSGNVGAVGFWDYGNFGFTKFALHFNPFLAGDPQAPGGFWNHPDTVLYWGKSKHRFQQCDSKYVEKLPSTNPLPSPFR